MNNSILLSVKDYCLVPKETTVFDRTICDAINSAFFTLHQLGCSNLPYKVDDEDQTWEDFTDNPILLSIVPDYVRQVVKLKFDPPANSFLVNQMTKEVEELTSRISYAVDPGWEVET